MARRAFFDIMRILLITPPLTQLNTPYPATAYLKGYYKAQGADVRQVDLGIEVADRVLSQEFLSDIGLEEQARLIEPVKRFLRGQDDTLGPRIANRSLLPEGKRFEQLDEDNLEWSFGVSGTTDKAMHLATLFIEDIADYVREHVDPHFDLVRYAEYLSNDAPTFDPLYAELQQEPSVIDQMMLTLLADCVSEFSPDKVCLTVPFPGCLYGALRCGQWLKANTKATIEIGGGFPNTEWRQLSDQRIYEFCDEVVIDGCREADQYCPDFSDLPLDKYLSLTEMTNPMHRLWSQGRWNKMVMAHGCYWHRCAFCDTSLDYVCGYKPTDIEPLYNGLLKTARQKGVYGIHFVDEALPPVALKKFALLNARAGNPLYFWGNVRFEKTFSKDLAAFLSYCGLGGVSAGIESATGTGLESINKGTDIASITQACCAFKEAGILVHAYMIYGFWNDTAQSIIDSMETLRQFFTAGLLDSAFWHKFVLTRNSTVYNQWEKDGTLDLVSGADSSSAFARNNLHFKGEEKFNKFGSPLDTALNAWMHGDRLEQKVQKWFDFQVPTPNVSRDFIEGLINQYEQKSSAKLTKETFEKSDEGKGIFWLGGKPLVCGQGKSSELRWIYLQEECYLSCQTLENKNPETVINLLIQLAPEAAADERINALNLIKKDQGLQKILSRLHNKGVVNA